MKTRLLSFIAVILTSLTANAQHEYVDLGLPSGTLWATTNIGAINPADYGDYFAWGETGPKSDYSWGSYKWMNPGQASVEQINKYTIADGNTEACWYDSNGQFIGDNKMVLEPEDDAATVNWGDDWQMPSLAQLRELINSEYTTSTWATKTRADGLLNYGIQITSKTNGNSIFLPAAGSYNGTKLFYEDDEVCYWSNHLGYHTSARAYSAWFAQREENETTPNYQSSSDGDTRYRGQCIRPVRTKKEVYTEFVASTGTLTYYYDHLRASRSGVTELYDPANAPVAARFSGYHDKVQKAVIDPSMKQAPLTSTSYMFFGNYDSSTQEWLHLSTMTSIEGLENLNTANVTDMRQMFRRCESLTTLDFSSFNTQNVTDMSDMFSQCYSLETLDLSSFNTENVTKMNNMFDFDYSLTRLDLSSFNTENVTTMEWMFYQCKLLKAIDLSSFKTPKVTNMECMFADCESLQTVDIPSFDISNETKISWMFDLCSNLNTIYCNNDWSKKSDFFSSHDMFRLCSSLVGGKGTTYDASLVDATYARPDGGPSAPGYFTHSSDKKEVYTEYVEATGSLTYYYDGLRTSRSGVTELYDPINNLEAKRFDGYSEKVLKAVIDPSMKSAPLTSMREMFAGRGANYLISMKSIEGLENLNTAIVTDMGYMFVLCSALTTLDVTSFNTENVTDMESMFLGCTSLTTLDLSTFNTGKVTKMGAMFNGCLALTTLNLNSFNTQNVTEMEVMFATCSSLPTLDLSSFNVRNVTDMSQMFNRCESLTTIYCDNDWSGIEAQSGYMFYSCTALVGGRGTTYDASFVDAAYARPDGGLSAPGYFTRKGEVVAYTVRYVDTEGNELKVARTGEAALGENVTLPESDKKPIYSRDRTKKYIYVSDNADEVVLTENVEVNVVTIVFREAEIYYATVNCMANGSYERLAQYNETFFEGDEHEVYPSIGLRGSDGKYYFTSVTRNNIKVCPFPANITPTVRGGKTYYSVIVLYNEDPSVAYYTDLENLGIAKDDDRFGIVGLGQFETLAEGNMTSPIDIDREYFSQGIGIGLFPESYVWTEPIAEAGTYRVSIYGKNADDRNTYPFSLGYRMANGDVYLYDELSVPAWPYAEEASLHVIDGVSIPAGTSLVLMNELSEEEYDGYNIQLDNIKLVRTGDYVELPVGISPLLTSPEEEGPVYNLAGQRLGKMQKGINIVGGRKVVVK